jgi:hypothetical protein
MDGKDEPTFHVPYHVTAITFLIIGIIAAGIFVCTLVLNQNHTALAQQQQPTLEGIFFQKERLFLLSVSLWFRGIKVVLFVHKPFDQQFNDAYFLVKVHLIYNSIDSSELI